MLRKTVSGMMLSLVLISTLTLAFNIQPVRASGTIFIRADGSIDPSTAPITTVDNITYTLTANITSDADGIVIERDNVVLDGEGHVIQGIINVASPRYDNNYFDGIHLSQRSNVTIKTIEIRAFFIGINLTFASGCVISQNYIENDIGVLLRGSSNNSLSGNNVNACFSYGICIGWGSDFANYNDISGNKITGTMYFGIGVDGFYNRIRENNFADNAHSGFHMQFAFCSHNSIVGNTFVDGYIQFHEASNNSVFHNNFMNCHILCDGSFPSSVNFFDNGYPSGGNYWSDYTGVDLYNGPYQNVTGSDGVSDTPHVIDSYNRDNYPFMNPNGWKTHPISVESNVTITNMITDRYSLNFTASGPTGQVGYVNATVPVGLNQTEIKVFIDKVELIPPFPIITTNGTHYFIYFEFTLSTHNITIQYAIADIATTNITPAKTVVGQGYTIRINATIQNQGDYEETFNVTLYANTTAITTQTITLTSLNSTTITFTWNTTGFAYGNYTIWAFAWPVVGETDTADNTCPDGWVFVAMPGDFTGQGYPPCTPLDGKVDFNDQMYFVDAFFSQFGIPPPAGVNPANCDLTGLNYPPLRLPDGKVDFNDQMCFVDCFFAQYGIPPPW